MPWFPAASWMLGRAPIVDFDGTIAALPVDWDALRLQIGVQRIDDIWAVATESWPLVTEAEIQAAGCAKANEALVHLLAETETFTVLTSNSSLAVYRFMERFSGLRAKLADVVGREQLAGPKSDFQTFTRGVQRCLAASGATPSQSPTVYIGDAAYELDFAARLGLKTIDVADITRSEG